MLYLINNQKKAKSIELLMNITWIYSFIHKLPIADIIIEVHLKESDEFLLLERII